MRRFGEIIFEMDEINVTIVINKIIDKIGVFLELAFILLVKLELYKKIQFD